MAPTGIKKAGNVDSGLVTPEEAARVRASVASKEQAPSVQEQTQIFGGWRQAADILGSPFETERIPLSKLHAMRRDPMLAFGLSFIKTPHVRANWHIEATSSDAAAPKAQIAAHLDYDLRKIYGPFVSAYLNSLDFGFQALAKRFVENPIVPATFIEKNPDTGEEIEKPVWEQGNVGAIGWKPFIALPPDIVEPSWQSGEFNGILYSTEGAQPIGGIQSTAEKESKFNIDLYHSLWITNERESNFGRLWGYPRLGYAYKYWWSYWFLWSIRDRSFEKKADPSIKILHPEGEFIDETTGQVVQYRDYALAVGERIRSGGVIALPSEPWEDINGRGTIRKWDIEYVEEAMNFEHFNSPFEDMQVQKLRSLWIPELAFIEGGGGTSSRNVAEELGSSFIESQAVLSQQIADHLNRWVIPQWLAVNYADYVEAGGGAKIVIQGFADRDIEFTKQIIQLVGQQESGQQEMLKLIELEKVLRDAGIPIATFADQQRRQQQIEQAAAQAQAQPVSPAAGGVGVIKSAAGFSYIDGPEEKVLFSESGTEFIESLPATKHYKDKAVKGFARQLRNLYKQLYKDEYEQAALSIESATNAIELSDDMVEFASFRDKAAEILKKWKESKRWGQAINRTQEILAAIIKRSARNEVRELEDGKMPSQKDIEEWVKNHIGEIVPQIALTTREEVRNFVATQLSEGKTDRHELARAIREHFSDFPDWKADRVARTETRDVFNVGTLLAAEESGIDRVQAIDGLFGPTDSECEDRDGQIFTIKQAFEEDEHPNGTLAFRPVPLGLSIEYQSDFEDGADFREEEMKLILADDLPKDMERKLLLKAVDRALGS